VVGGAGAGNYGRVESKTPLVQGGLVVEMEDPTSCFDVREMGKIENSPPHIKT